MTVQYIRADQLLTWLEVYLTGLFVHIDDFARFVTDGHGNICLLEILHFSDYVIGLCFSDLCRYVQPVPDQSFSAIGYNAFGVELNTIVWQ